MFGLLVVHLRGKGVETLRLGDEMHTLLSIGWVEVSDVIGEAADLTVGGKGLR
jgi:hypothetical protein